MFGFACTLFNVYAVQTVWNWHAPAYLGAKPVSFQAVFLLAFLLKTLVLGRTGQNINQTKRIMYIHSGIYWDTSVRDNIKFLEQTCVVLAAAYLLKQYGGLL
jgi:hypothetical protein